MPGSVTETLAPRLREEMNRKNMAPLALARQAGVGRSFIYDLLNGKSENPTAGKLEKVARALNISIPYLLGGEALASDMIRKDGYTGIRWLDDGTVCDPVKESYLPTALIQRLSSDSTRLRLLNVRSDEMEPTIFPGDTLLIDTDAVSGFTAGIYAIREGDAMAFRRLNITRRNSDVCYVVRADNTNYEAYTAARDCLNILGKAVWRMGAV